MEKRSSISYLITLLSFLIVLSGCSTVKVVGPFEQSFVNKCKTTFSTVISAPEDKEKKAAVIFNNVPFKSILFSYKDFSSGLRDEVGCIVSHIEPKENLAVAFYNETLNTGLVFLEDTQNEVLLSLSFAAKPNGDRAVKIEIYGPLSTVLQVLDPNFTTNTPLRIQSFGEFTAEMPKEAFDQFIGNLSNGKLPKREQD